MERKWLRVILIVAVLLTVGMAGYTMQAALEGERSFRVPSKVSANEQKATAPSASQPPIDEKLFPTQLAGMTRVEAIGGQEAISSVGQLHGLDITLAEAFVVSYQGKDLQMTIWYSEGKNEQEATQLYQAMDKKMPQTSAFKDYKTVKVDGKDTKYVSGMGQDHYYWQSGKRVMWVAISGGNTPDILKQVLRLY